MNIYLASRYGRRDKMREYRDRIELAGHRVTSRWIDTEWVDDGESACVAPGDEASAWAENDMEDVQRADCVVSFSSGGVGGRGGRHAEFGMGLIQGKRMILVGPPEHVFHFHRRVEQVPDWETALRLLDECSPARLAAEVRDATK